MQVNVVQVGFMTEAWEAHARGREVMIPRNAGGVAYEVAFEGTSVIQRGGECRVLSVDVHAQQRVRARSALARFRNLYHDPGPCCRVWRHVPKLMLVFYWLLWKLYRFSVADLISDQSLVKGRFVETVLIRIMCGLLWSLARKSTACYLAVKLPCSSVKFA